MNRRRAARRFPPLGGDAAFLLHPSLFKTLEFPALTTQPFLVALGFAFCLSTLAQGAEPTKGTYTDEASAGPDFALQGEYKGSVETDEGIKTFGVQVIALGEGNFRLVGYPGGLPGDGWMPGQEEKKSIEAKADGGRISIPVDEAVLEVTPEAIEVTVGGQTLGTLRKVHRQSPTLGKQPPEGALVLFDGSSADAFENGQLVEGKWLAASNAASKEKFGDHHLHVEFRTPFMPAARGQGRGNSGVYVQGRYEVQVLDSFGLEGKNNECGGIYSIAEPIVNMCLPPLAWQTYDIDFTAARYDSEGKKERNARVTIRHNGVVIHDDLELPHGTPGYRPEGPGPESLFLQDHGNPVVFRNIWVVKK